MKVSIKSFPTIDLYRSTIYGYSDNMASIPLKNMTTIYERANENTPEKVRMGNYSAELDYPRFRLWHYGTLILTLDVERGIEFLGGFSASDRDAINSILELTGMNARVSIAGGYMHVA